MSESKKSSKDKIIDTASRLFQKQGYYATGLNQIIQESGAPKGSLYYYFPNGKEELASVAVGRTADLVTMRIQEGLKDYDDPIEAIQQFILNLANAFKSYETKQGLPVASVALETAQTSEVIRQSCQQAYEKWHEVFAKKLVESGFEEKKALELGLVINAMIEGAFIIVITTKDCEPLRQIARYIPNLCQ
ncbi:TetR/AcrR family transcriptional regulator [Bacillus sp. FJAT-45037]|uniref:TetR/AcrR family transcriptional regulator n=1 Tax=Bacillus sp. FJAT-45037 TaxID=2011007 RepID=UPI000C249908|nr:TetR/AcrR family transcriptional regulator [Bacillus sp. FJAT-45037]